jgi:signal transduction histidine kinase
LRVRQLAAGLQARLEERLEERERIARDLHDTLLQGIFSAAIELEIAEDRMPADSQAKPLVQHALEVMRKVGKEGRNTIRSLRSTHSQRDGLEESLSRVQKQFVLKKDVAFHVEAEGEPRPLRPLIRDEIYSIGREAVVNAFRHSRGQTIEVGVQYSARDLRLVVRDDGCGIDEAVLRTGREGHWGLTGMRERAEKIGAKLEVLSRIGGGTEVQLSVAGKIAYEASSASWLPRWWAVWRGRRASQNIPPDDKKEEP